MKTLSDKELKKLKIDRAHCERVEAECQEFTDMINKKYEANMIPVEIARQWKWKTDNDGDDFEEIWEEDD